MKKIDLGFQARKTGEGAYSKCSRDIDMVDKLQSAQLSSSGSEAGGVKLLLVRGKPEMGDDVGFWRSSMGWASGVLVGGLSDEGV